MFTKSYHKDALYAIWGQLAFKFSNKLSTDFNHCGDNFKTTFKSRKKSLSNVSLYIFFMNFTHIHSPEAEAYNPQSVKILMAAEGLCYFDQML